METKEKFTKKYAQDILHHKREAAEDSINSHHTSLNSQCHAHMQVDRHKSNMAGRETLFLLLVRQTGSGVEFEMDNVPVLHQVIPTLLLVLSCRLQNNNKEIHSKAK